MILCGSRCAQSHAYAKTSRGCDPGRSDVSDDGVIVQTGWIAQTNQEMEIKNVEEVNVDQSFFGRLFGYGTIQIRGTGINSIVLQWIAAPYELRRVIELALQKQTDASSNAKLRT